MQIQHEQFPSLRVLCVDDNQEVCSALEAALMSISGAQVVGWLSSADDLVPTVERLRPDIVLLDVDMPGRNAFEALREVAQRYPDTRVIILSGHVRRDWIDNAVEAGAWGYVSKNDGADSLNQAIEEVYHGKMAFSPEIERQI